MLVSTALLVNIDQDNTNIDALQVTIVLQDLLLWQLVQVVFTNM